MTKVDMTEENHTHLRGTPPPNLPHTPWFKPRRYGWGWVPARWQGWLVILLYIVLISIIVSGREDAVPGDPASGSNFLTFALPIIILTSLLILIAYKKGGKPRWQWGPPKNPTD